MEEILSSLREMDFRVIQKRIRSRKDLRGKSEQSMDECKPWKTAGTRNQPVQQAEKTVRLLESINGNLSGLGESENQGLRRQMDLAVRIANEILEKLP